MTKKLQSWNSNNRARFPEWRKEKRIKKSWKKKTLAKSMRIPFRRISIRKAIDARHDGPASCTWRQRWLPVISSSTGLRLGHANSAFRSMLLIHSMSLTLLWRLLTMTVCTEARLDYRIDCWIDLRVAFFSWVWLTGTTSSVYGFRKICFSLSL